LKIRYGGVGIKSNKLPSITAASERKATARNGSVIPSARFKAKKTSITNLGIQPL